MGNSEHVSVKVVTWRQPSPDLVPQSGEDVTESEVQLRDKVSLGVGESGCFIAKEGDTEADTEGLCMVVKRHDFFLLRSSEEMWLPIRYLNPLGQLLLSPGMEIRIGRLKYTVEELEIIQESQQDLNPADHSANVSFENICRICLSGTASTHNPLLTLCKCTGTLQYIHFECAKSLFLSKIRTNDSPVVDSFKAKEVICELCHSELPLTHIEEEVEYGIKTMFRPSRSYLKLTSIADTNEFHFLHPTVTRSAKIGRGPKNDMNLANPSVSRIHATLELTQEGFVLKDEKSRFGTMVRAIAGVCLPYGEQRVVQIRKSLFYFTAKKPLRLSQCCCPCRSSQSESVSSRRESVCLSVDRMVPGEPASPKQEDGLIEAKEKP